ncbi:DUF3006 domain-containing protein [Halanaerobaculum tunisiense]
MLVIDRFEGNKAIIEYENQTFDIPKKILPTKAKTGDIIEIVINKERTNKRQKEIDELKEDLFE